MERRKRYIPDRKFVDNRKVYSTPVGLVQAIYIYMAGGIFIVSLGLMFTLQIISFFTIALAIGTTALFLFSMAETTQGRTNIGFIKRQMKYKNGIRSFKRGRNI